LRGDSCGKPHTVNIKITKENGTILTFVYPDE
jgi:hypothetical protein